MQTEFAPATTLDLVDGLNSTLTGTVIEDTCGRFEEGAELLWARVRERN